MGYSIPSQKILQDNHNNLLQKLLTSFGDSSDYSGLQEFRQAVFFDLFQNNDSRFRTHQEIFTSTLADSINFRHYNPLQLSDVTEYLQTSLLTFFNEPNLNFRNTMYTFVHHSPSDIVSFYKKELQPFLIFLRDDTDFNLDFDIPKEIVLDGPRPNIQEVKDLYNNLHNFALSNDIKINDLKIVNEQVLFNLLEPLTQELYNVELGAMMGVVPGTEGTRPAINFTLALYESLDEIFENLDTTQQQLLAKKFEHFAMDIPSHELHLLEDYKDMPKEFLERKLRTYLTNFVDNANEYMKGQDGFIENLVYDRNAYFDRGGGIRQYAREMFVKELIETELVDIDILVRNSPDPIGLLVALDDSHQPFAINSQFPPFVSQSVVNKLGELFNLNTDGSFNVEKIFRPGYEGMTIAEVLAETLDYPNRPDFNDITPIINKLEKYDQPIGEDGTLFLTPNPDSPQNIIFEDDVVVYHSRPAEKGPLPSDVNFHAGTYQAAMDRASFFYEGQSMHEMLGETLVELDENLSAVLDDINPLEDYDTTFSADYGTDNNTTSITGHLDYTADEGHLEIRYSVDGEWVDGFGYPIIDEYYDVEDVSSLREISGDLNTADYIAAETIFEKLPLGPGSEFQWANGYSLYEISIPKDARVLNLDAPISVVQRGMNVEISGDMLQEAVENGLNRGLDPTYDDITEITIGTKRVSIDENLTPAAIEDMIFGDYDVIAYQNNIEDVGSTSYIIKSNSNATVRAITGPKLRLFNNRVIRAFVSNNPFFFGESFFDNKRQIEKILDLVPDNRKQDVQTILEFYKKVAQGEEGLETSVEKANLDKLFIDDADTPTNVVDDINVRNLTDQQLYDEFVKYSKITLEAEKFDDLTPELQNIQQTQDWETFSRARGYTEQEISDFKRYLDLSAEMEDRFPGKDGSASLAQGINYELQHEDSITTLEEWKNFNSTDTPTNVVDGPKFKIENVPNPKQVATLQIDGMLHAQPTAVLSRILQDAPEELFIQTPEGLVKANTINILKLNNPKEIEIVTYDTADAKTAYDYLFENTGNLFEGEGARGAASFRIKPVGGRPLGPGAAFVDELDEAIASSDGVENLNKAKAVIRNNPGVFRKVLNVVEKLDIGDQVIQQVLKRAFPRIGLSALAGPVGIAYALYETALLLSDVGNAVYQQQTTDESFWENFGEVSDKYSIAYKISKPFYDTLFEAVKADLEDNDTLYLLGR